MKLFASAVVVCSLMSGAAFAAPQQNQAPAPASTPHGHRLAAHFAMLDADKDGSLSSKKFAAGSRK